jgi:hypothetical protein
MLAPILLATALVARVPHLPVHQAVQPIVVGREAPRRVEEGSLSMFAYCDARGQSWITMTNATPTAVVLEWTRTSTMAGFAPDVWSSVSQVEPGQSEGWMSPARYLHLEIRYDDDGLPTTNSIDASCAGTASATTIDGEASGLGE